MSRKKKSRGRKLKVQDKDGVSLGGDHGTGTPLAIAGTVIKPMLNDKGENPNSMGRRQKVNQIDRLMDRNSLSMRQYQAAMEIQEAYCRTEMLSSGSALKEQVDATAKPDAVIARQVDANARLVNAMRAVPQAMRYVVEHVCWYNLPLHECDPGMRKGSAAANLKVALDLVANHMKY